MEQKYNSDLKILFIVVAFPMVLLKAIGVASIDILEFGRSFTYIYIVQSIVGYFSIGKRTHIHELILSPLISLMCLSDLSIAFQVNLATIFYRIKIISLNKCVSKYCKTAVDLCPYPRTSKPLNYSEGIILLNEHL